MVLISLTMTNAHLGKTQYMEGIVLRLAYLDHLIWSSQQYGTMEPIMPHVKF